MGGRLLPSTSCTAAHWLSGIRLPASPMEKAFGNMEGLNQMNQQGLGLPWIRHSQNIGHVHEFLLSLQTGGAATAPWDGGRDLRLWVRDRDSSC